MKKKMISALFVNCLLVATAQQTTIDFENLSLPSVDTFYNGADNAGGFQVSTTNGTVVHFSNSYTASTWGDFWSGFSYSNMTDNTTPGYLNQYSAITGNGYDNSSNYLVYYPEGLISFSQPVLVDSIQITNTTYAALSMLNGDNFSKQFGSTTNANGEIDTTNGEDFFKVWIIGFDSQMQRTDSVVFYLADYRFADNSQDYIVDVWEHVDLSSIGEVSFLTLKFESSDMSFGFINTPQYCAIDQLSFSNVLTISEEMTQAISVYPNPTTDFIQVKGVQGEVKLFDTLGKTVAVWNTSGNQVFSMKTFEAGVYFLSVEDQKSSQQIRILKN